MSEDGMDMPQVVIGCDPARGDDLSCVAVMAGNKIVAIHYGLDRHFWFDNSSRSIRNRYKFKPNKRGFK